jgi:hypothetical protein
MALAWADDPLDLSDFFPPQATAPAASDPGDADGAAALLSLPHALRAATVAADTVIANALPSVLTGYLFLFRLVGSLRNLGDPGG